MPRRRASVWPSNVKFTSSMPWRSAHAPNSASAPGAAPLNRMKSSLCMVGIQEIEVRRQKSGVRRQNAGDRIKERSQPARERFVLVPFFFAELVGFFALLVVFVAVPRGAVGGFGSPLFALGAPPRLPGLSAAP